MDATIKCKDNQLIISPFTVNSISGAMMNSPPVQIVTLLNITFMFRVTPELLAKARVEKEPAITDPLPEMVCGLVPFSTTVPADAGAKIRVATLATKIFPLTEWPGEPVMLK